MSEFIEFAKILREITRHKVGLARLPESLDAAIAEYESTRRTETALTEAEIARVIQCSKDCIPPAPECRPEEERLLKRFAEQTTPSLDEWRKRVNLHTYTHGSHWTDCWENHAECAWAGLVAELESALAAAQAEVERLRAMIVPGDAAAHEEHMAALEGRAEADLWQRLHAAESTLARLREPLTEKETTALLRAWQEPCGYIPTAVLNIIAEFLRLRGVQS